MKGSQTDTGGNAIDMVAGAAHDLKTPLTYIRGAADQIYRDAYDPTEAKLAAHKIEQSAERLLHLIDGLIGLAHAEQTSLKLEPLSAIDLVRQSVAAIDPFAQVLGQEIDVRVPKSLPPVATHRQAVDRILYNLLDNALKFSRTQKPIRIRAHRTNPDTVSVSIRDYGAGISPKELKTIFSMFGRAANPSRTVTGSGLGLYVAAQLSEQIQAKLHVTPLKVGTTFRVDLPIIQQAALF
jgi:signal transduction histidine kinase